MSNRPDPIKLLQAAARRAADHVGGGHPGRVVVVDLAGRKLLDVTVPMGAVDKDATDPPAVVPGWSFTERAAYFDGTAVPVSPSRLRLLRVLAEAEGPLMAKELAKLAFDRTADEENVRYHVAALKKDLAKSFADFGELIPNGGEGYRLALR